MDRRTDNSFLLKPGGGRDLSSCDNSPGTETWDCLFTSRPVQLGEPLGELLALDETAGCCWFQFKVDEDEGLPLEPALSTSVT